MKKKTAFNAARMTASVFGVLAGLGGLVHGIGEVLQGNVQPGSLIIDSWTQGPIATNLGGEPGMTLVPNLLATGILTIVVSLAVVVQASVVRDRKGGRRLILLSVAMLLAGGGFGPPILGMLAGLAGTRIGVTSSWWDEGQRAKIGQRVGALWPWIFGLAAMNGVFLVIGSVVLVYLFDLSNPDLFTNSFFFSVLSLSLMIAIGRAYDARKGEQRIAA